jgi:uncharacterized protein YcbX
MAIYEHTSLTRRIFIQSLAVDCFRYSLAAADNLTAQKYERAENAWIGRTLALGDAVRLSITGPCARCVMTTLAQGDLPKDAGILRAAAQHNRANVGVYASVLEGGKIRRGEPVRVE